MYKKSVKSSGTCPNNNGISKNKLVQMANLIPAWDPIEGLIPYPTISMKKGTFKLITGQDIDKRGESQVANTLDITKFSPAIQDIISMLKPAQSPNSKPIAAGCEQASFTKFKNIFHKICKA